jgi:hypothetical protein
MWTPTISILPAGYKPLPLTALSTKPGPFPSHGMPRAETSHLLSNFGAAHKKVGICIDPEESDFNFYIAYLTKTQQQNKQARFYISTTNEDFLVHLVDVFRFFNPGPKVYRNIFYTVPNYHYNCLTDKERLSVDIKMLQSMDSVITSKGVERLKYIKKTEGLEISYFEAEESFVFNVEKESIL